MNCDVGHISCMLFFSEVLGDAGCMRKQVSGGTVTCRGNLRCAFSLEGVEGGDANRLPLLLKLL